MGPVFPLVLSRTAALSSHGLHRALQLPPPSVVSRRSWSLLSSSAPDPYRYRVTITPHQPVDELDGKKQPGIRQWAFMGLIIAANLFILKLLLERMDEKRLQGLEKERVSLVAEGAILRKALQSARKEWQKADVQEKQQALMMHEKSTEVKERMTVLKEKAQELMHEWVVRDIKEKAILLFTSEERVALEAERRSLEVLLREGETSIPKQTPEAASSSSSESLTSPTSTEGDVSALAAAAPSLADEIAEIDSRLTNDARATELKTTLIEEKAALIEDAKVSNEEARVLREEWAEKDHAERTRRLHLKHQKAILADEAKDLTSKLDELEKTWQVLKVKINEAKGNKKTSVVDMLDPEDSGEKDSSAVKDDAETEVEVEVDVPSGVEEETKGE